MLNNHLGLVDHIWDPLSLTQTALAVNLVKRLVLDYPTVSAEKKNTQVCTVQKNNPYQHSS